MNPILNTTYKYKWALRANIDGNPRVEDVWSIYSVDDVGRIQKYIAVIYTSEEEAEEIVRTHNSKYDSLWREHNRSND